MNYKIIAIQKEGKKKKRFMFIHFRRLLFLLLLLLFISNIHRWFGLTESNESERLNPIREKWRMKMKDHKRREEKIKINVYLDTNNDQIRIKPG